MAIVHIELRDAIDSDGKPQLRGHVDFDFSNPDKDGKFHSLSSLTVAQRVAFLINQRLADTLAEVLDADDE